MESAGRWVVEEDDLLACCGSTKFAKQMAAISPFTDLHQAVQAARDIWFNKVDVNGWLEAFSAHPQIGQSPSSSITTETSAQWSKGEQSTAIATATSTTLQELTEWNAKYKQKFGFVFLICASGRSTAEILAELKRRYPNRPVIEFEKAAQEQMKITELRLAKLFSANSSTAAAIEYQPASVAIKAHGDGDDEEQIEENDDDRAAPLVEKELRKKYWSQAEDEVLVKAWLQVSQDESVNAKKKGFQFWSRVTHMFEQVRCYRERCWAEKVEGMRVSDRLNVRALEPLRCRWNRINISVSKFVDAYAEAEAGRKSCECNDDVMKTAYAIYKNDDKNHRDFRDKHCWDILSLTKQWKPIGKTIKRCKKRTIEESGSKRNRINESDDFSPSTDLNTPTSDDIGRLGQPPSDGSSKIKGNGKDMDMPSEAFQQWLDSIEKMNLTRASEITRIKYDKDVEVEKQKAESEGFQLAKEKEARKHRKINLELFKVLSSKEYLMKEEQELKNNLVKKIA